MSAAPVCLEVMDSSEKGKSSAADPLSMVRCRHKMEERYLKSRIQQLKINRRMTEEERLRVSREMESEMKVRHEKEIKDYESGVLIPSPVAVSPTSPHSSEVVVKEDARTKELNLINSKLLVEGLRVRFMSADGNCLFRSLADQLSRNESHSEYTYDTLRATSIHHMKCNQTEFLPLVLSHMVADSIDEGESIDSSLSEEARFERYCDRMKLSSGWGGLIEIRALSAVLRSPIRVIRAEDDTILVGDGILPTLTVTHHKHYLSAGHHYNSVEPVESKAVGSTFASAFDD